MKQKRKLVQIGWRIYRDQYEWLIKRAKGAGFKDAEYLRGLLDTMIVTLREKAE